MIPPLDLGDEAGGGGDGEGEGLLLWQTQVALALWEAQAPDTMTMTILIIVSTTKDDEINWKLSLKLNLRDIELVVQEEADEGNQFSSP